MSVTANNSDCQSKALSGAQGGILSKLINYLRQESTFFRLHLSAFVFIPLVFSGIFYACNGRFHIKYLDSLFFCYSAMTDTGLTTADMSTLTAWQQVLLFLLMAMGDNTTISWIMVLVRKQYFKNRCEYVASLKRYRGRSRTLLNNISPPQDQRLYAQPVHSSSNCDSPDNFREQAMRPTQGAMPPESNLEPVPELQSLISESLNEHPLTDAKELSSSPPAINAELPNMVSPPVHNDAPNPLSPISIRQRRVLRYDGSTLPYPRRGMTIINTHNNLGWSGSPDVKNKYQGLGGFPGPFQIIKRLIRRTAPTAYRKFERSMTIPSTTTLEEKSTRWLSFDGLVVGRNSDFHTETLTDDQLEEIGGTEYRALRLLSYLIPIYFIATQLIAFLLFAPWLSTTKKYDGVFQGQPRLVQKPWYSLFLTMSAYTGTGLDLVDVSMIPFQDAYLMIFGIMFVLLAGNHAQPVFLRFIIWVGSRFTREGSEMDETLSFLLHHPRRCFLYLFPSHQTWFLFAVLVLLSAIEWTAFGVLNIGLDVFQSLSTGPRVIIGLFQGIAVRASGLTIIPIGSLAPSVQFLYIVLMYIAVYPVAMCIRATNVYEERSLGIFEVPEGDIQDNLEELEPRERVGRYMGWHLRQQLSNDIWWLLWGIFLVLIIERGNITDKNKDYFNIFAVIFEFVSAFAGVGLSLGFRDDNFSLVGAMSPLSKLIVIIIMIRGRHRGLPVAVDRAVLLPSELVVNNQAVKNTTYDPRQEPIPNHVMQ